MSSHRTMNDISRAFDSAGPGILLDPGDAGTITVKMWGQQCLLTSGAGAETRTLARPTKPGILASIAFDTDGGGDITMTVTGGYNFDGDTSITFGDAKDMVVFMSVKTGTTYQWQVIAQGGTDAVVEDITADAATITKLTAGADCTNAGASATVSGGTDNVASGIVSTVAGGNNNLAFGQSSTVSGGFGNDALNVESTVAGGSGNTAQGSGSTVTGGCRNTANGGYSRVGGSDAVATNHGQDAYAAGKFGTAVTDYGNAQRSTHVAFALVTHDDADWHDLFTDGATKQMVIPTDTVWTFRVLLSGASVGCAKVFSYIIEGAIVNDGGSTTILGPEGGDIPTVTTIFETDGDFNAQVVADNTNDALVIQVTDATSGGDVVRWVANIETAEVTFPAA